MVLVTCTLLVITMKCANTSCHCLCHCEPCRIHGAAICLPVLHLPQALCHLRRNVVTDAIPLQAALVFGLLRYARNDKSKMAASSKKTPRHDNSHYVRDDKLFLTNQLAQNDVAISNKFFSQLVMHLVHFFVGKSPVTSLVNKCINEILFTRF